jgi:hypothetical protein
MAAGVRRPTMSDPTRREALRSTFLGTMAVGLAGLGPERAAAEERGGAKAESPAGLFQSEGKVDPEKADLPAVLRSGWDSFTIRLGKGDEWEGAEITVSSAWGEGNDGKDLWGWIGGAPVAHSKVLKDDRGYYFIYSLRSGIGTSQSIAAAFRYVLRGQTHGVGCVSFSLA